MKKIVAQGAEAKIILTKKAIIKDRIKKGYRHPTLDEKIRKRRTKKEAKLLKKAAEAKINVPKVINTKKYEIEIEFLKGERLSETLKKHKEKEQYKIMKKIGEQTAKLHENNIIHGDLTTSNTILTTKGKIYIIDFGLGYTSTKIEDKAVDIHLIKQALEAKHYQNNKKLFEEFIKGYKWKEKNKVIERLKTVEKRGRYKH